MIFPLSRYLFKSTFLKFQIYVAFPVIILLLISSIIAFGLENTLLMILIILK